MNENELFFEEILRLAFKKVEKDTGESSLSKQAQVLSVLINEKEKEKGFGDKTYERYFNKYVLKKLVKEVKNPTMDVFNGLLHFLDYKNFKDFKLNNAHLIVKKKPSIKKTSTERVKNNNIEKERIDKKNSNPIEVTIKNSFKINKVLLYCVVAITGLIGMFVLNDVIFKEQKTQPTTVIYNRYNGNLNYYYATKKDGEILLYDDFQSNNNKNLKPVTKEVMLTYFKQQQVEVTNEDQQRWFKVNLEEENSNKKVKTGEISTVTVKEKPAEKPMNTTKVAIKNNAVLDTQISGYFEQLYAKTNEEYVATGSVIYTFKESSFSKEMVVCELVLTYKVKLYTSNATFEVNSITITATGLSEIDAKNNAIKKLQFN